MTLKRIIKYYTPTLKALDTVSEQAKAIQDLYDQVREFYRYITDTEFRNSLKGEKGDKGATGEVGPQGPAGPQGPQGITGSVGPIGPIGPKGEDGSFSDLTPEEKASLKGDKGDKGDKGEQGIQGIQGERGEKGDKGDKGDTGAKGDKGDVGTTDYNQLDNKPTKLSEFTNDVGYLTQHQDISGKEDKTSIESVPTGSVTLSADVNKYYTFVDAIETFAIILPSPTDATKVQTIVFFMTIGTTPAITFSSANTILYQKDFTLDASKTYEVNALFNGSAWVIAAVEIEIPT